MILQKFTDYFSEYKNVKIENYLMEYIIIETTININGKKLRNMYRIPIRQIYAHYDLSVLCLEVKREINRRITHTLKGYNYFMEENQYD